MALSGGRCPSAEAATYLVNHVVLPPQLPQADDFDAARERFLLDTTMAALRALKAFTTTDKDGMITNAIVSTDNLKRSRNQLGDIDEVAYRRNNGSDPLEIKTQNAGILISSDGADVTFQFFELCPNNKSAILKGRLIRSFPARAASIPATKLQEKGLQCMLAQTLAS